MVLLGASDLFAKNCNVEKLTVSLAQGFFVILRDLVSSWQGWNYQISPVAGHIHSATQDSRSTVHLLARQATVSVILLIIFVDLLSPSICFARATSSSLAWQGPFEFSRLVMFSLFFLSIFFPNSFSGLIKIRCAACTGKIHVDTCDIE